MASTPRSEHAFWAALALAGIAYEVRALKEDHLAATLSDVTRQVFRTDTPAGRAAFTFAWGGLCAWYAHHILSGDQP